MIQSGREATIVSRMRARSRRSASLEESAASVSAAQFLDEILAKQTGGSEQGDAHGGIVNGREASGDEGSEPSKQVDAAIQTIRWR